MPGVNAEELLGTLIVLEGPDGSGRSSQIRFLRSWLEGRGHAVVDLGLAKSGLIREELDTARRGNMLAPLTRTLFYATDLADQIENTLVPGLRAGSVVLADRYIFTLMARDLARGANINWLQQIFGFALIPDVVVYLDSTPETLAQRVLHRDGILDYWESGIDLGLSRDRYESFILYQTRLRQNFGDLLKSYDIRRVDGEQRQKAVQEDLRQHLIPVLAKPA